MTRYLGVRLAWSVAVLFGLSLLFFFLEQITPHGACGAVQLAPLPGAPGGPRAMATCIRQFALGQSLPVQYVHLMAHYLRGDAGPQSLTIRYSVLSEAMNIGFMLLSAAVVQVTAAVALGSAAALWPRSWFGRVFAPVAVVGRAVPPFLLGVVSWLVPVGTAGAVLGATTANGHAYGPYPLFWSPAWFAFLVKHPGPLLSQAVPPFIIAIIAYVAVGAFASALVVRDALIAELRKTYVIAARAGGLSRERAVRRALRAVLSAAMTATTGQSAALLGAMAALGFVLHPSFTHLGNIFYQAGVRDVVTAQGFFMGATVAVLIVGLLTGLLHGLLDPRVRHGGALPPEPAPVVAPTRSRARQLWFLASLALLALLVGMAVFAPLLSPTSFTLDFTPSLLPPRLAWPWQHGWRYLLGTDSTGRSILTWVTYGARIPLAVGLLAAAVATALGLALSALRALPGALGAAADLLVRWVAAVLTTPPSILLVFLLVVYLARNQWALIALLIGLVTWPRIARVPRSPMVRRDRTQALLPARALGVSGPRLLWRGLRPLIGPVIGAACRLAALAIALDAFIDFVAYGSVDAGVPVSYPTWGNAIASNAWEVVDQQGTIHWWLLLFPGLCIVLAALALTGVAEGLELLLASPRRRRETTWLRWPAGSSHAAAAAEAQPTAARQESFH